MSIVQGRSPGPTQTADSKLIAHRDKLLGLWAAERMGMLGEVAAEYALSLVGTAADKSRDDAALVRKVCADMGARGYPIAEADVGRQLATCASKARAELNGGRAAVT